MLHSAINISLMGKDFTHPIFVEIFDEKHLSVTGKYIGEQEYKFLTI